MKTGKQARPACSYERGLREGERRAAAALRELREALNETTGDHYAACDCQWCMRRRVLNTEHRRRGGK